MLSPLLEPVSWWYCTALTTIPLSDAMRCRKGKSTGSMARREKRHLEICHFVLVPLTYALRHVSHSNQVLNQVCTYRCCRGTWSVSARLRKSLSPVENNSVTTPTRHQHRCIQYSCFVVSMATFFYRWLVSLRRQRQLACAFFFTPSRICAVVLPHSVFGKPRLYRQTRGADPAHRTRYEWALVHAF